MRLDAARLEKRLAHWRSVVASACEQCGRARLPGVAAPIAVADAGTHAADAALRLTLDPGGEHSMASLAIDAGDSIAIAIGPEGGWSPRDREQLAAAGFEGLRLGPRILRTETAGIAAIAALQAMAGDLG